MVLDCSRNPWFQPEGSVHLRTVVHVTDADGRYSFSRLDKSGCAGEVVAYCGGEAQPAAPAGR
jgi:hypothetical protein